MTDNNTPTSFDEEGTYAAVLSELESGSPRPGIWAKAYAEMDGDEAKSKALYIKRRVEQEKDQFERAYAKQEIYRRAEEERTQQKQKDDLIASALRQLNAKGYRISKNTLGWWVVRDSNDLLMGGGGFQTNAAFIKYARTLVEMPPETLPSNNEHGGCPEFCVNGFRLMLRHPVLELDSKPIQCGLPVTDWHGPFFTYVFQREVKQF